MSYIMSCIGSICLLGGSVLPIFWIERMGRRRTMLLGAWTCGICMGMIAATGAVSSVLPEPSNCIRLGRGCICAALSVLFRHWVSRCVSSATSSLHPLISDVIRWNSMYWLYASEIRSLRMRNRTSSSMCLAHWATNFLTVMVAPTGFTSLGW